MPGRPVLLAVFHQLNARHVDEVPPIGTETNGGFENGQNSFPIEDCCGGTNSLTAFGHTWWYNSKYQPKHVALEATALSTCKVASAQTFRPRNDL